MISSAIDIYLATRSTFCIATHSLQINYMYFRWGIASATSSLGYSSHPTLEKRKLAKKEKRTLEYSTSNKKSLVDESNDNDEWLWFSKVIFLSLLPVSVSPMQLLGDRKLISIAICFPYHEHNNIYKINVDMSACLKSPVEMQDWLVYALICPAFNI